MNDFNYLKIYSLGRLTISERIQPVDKESPIILHLLKEPEYIVSINLINAIDNFIYAGLTETPTKAYLNELIIQAYKKYSFVIAMKLNIHSISEFKDFCIKRYCNENQMVKITGIIIKLRGVDILG